MTTTPSAATPSALTPAAVLFDMDGTLIDSEPIWFATEVAILAEYGFDLGPEHTHQVLGKPNEIVVEYLLGVSGIPLTPEQLNQRIDVAMATRLDAGIELIPGAKELLTEIAAAGIPAALVSASSRRVVDACLGSIGAHNFKFTVSGDDVTQPKPHPEPYLKAAALLGVDPADCVVVEDSPSGTAAGAAAGCRVMSVPHGVPVAEHPLVTIATALDTVTLERLRGLFG